MAQYKVDFKMIEWQAPMDGVRFKANKQNGKQLRFVEYTKKMPPHWCENGHIGYVLEGEFEITFDGEVVIFKPGEGIFIPAGKEHKHMARALTNIVKIVFVEEI